tara:strand:- start:720 stop:1775 length:1056 start_codon:yes stop_codon:yes gene_type:complete
LGKFFIINQILKTQLLLGFLLFFFNCGTPITQFSFDGETMGTTYNIKIVTDKNFDTKEIKTSIDSILVVFNQQMSTWDPKSEISTFNRWNSLDSFKVSQYFYDVVKEALVISEQSQGMFDITVFDLLSLWGFGPNPKSGIPEKNKIDSVLAYTGFQFLNAKEYNLIKKHKKTRIDLNAIAKGYGVDIIFDYIQSLGYENIFVEIGGEVRFSGHNRNFDNWSIGLENPPSGLMDVEDPFFGIFKGESAAVATSANYRNFVDLDGTILGHTINPKTGFPVQTDVLSVSVVAETCMEADAWATALMTLSYEDGLKILDKFKNIGAAWLLKTGKTTRVIAKKGDFRIIEPIFEMK